MPYLSHPVRRMRQDPDSGESVTLVVTAADEDDDAAATLADRLADVGTVEDRLRFGAVKVTVPQAAVADVCDLDGIQSIETANTLAMDADGAGEDVDYGK